jgi:hypothetical protein
LKPPRRIRKSSFTVLLSSEATARHAAGSTANVGQRAPQTRRRQSFHVLGMALKEFL